MRSYDRNGRQHMTIASLLTNGVWAGLLSGAFVILFAAPLQFLGAAASLGFLARVLRDALMLAGASSVPATFCAATAVVFVTHAVIPIRRPGVTPAVLVSALIPLGAAKPFFEAIIGLVRTPSLKGDALAAAPAALMSDVATVVTMTLAVALGVAVGALASGAIRSFVPSEDAP